MDTSDREIVQEFLVESYENLDKLEDCILALESASGTEVIGRVFRTIHTIKGTSGFLGFHRLEALTHAGETLLSLIRDGKVVCSAEIANLLLKLTDTVKRILSIIEKTGAEGAEDTTSLAAALAQAAAGSATLAASEPIQLSPTVPSAVIDPPRAFPGPEVHSPEALLDLHGSVVVDGTRAEGEGKSSSLADGNVRVAVQVLDRLMDLVGELVLARNQINQLSSRDEDGTLTAASQRLSLVTTELQEGVMKTRLQPISNMWSKVPRLVREVATGCGKKVRLEMEGGDTELDRTILEAIRDPLTHIIRNAIDHGLEEPQERKAAGKGAEGCLRVRAFHEGGKVNLEVSDDGRGVNLERVRERAIERGLINRELAAQTPDREIYAFIFLPGFSTARTVTNVSGRGVGMDVVKTNVERVGGTVDIDSRPGRGMTVRIKIPLTLAIVPALIIAAAGERYAIPQASLIELVRIDREQVASAIETIFGSPVYRLRGNLLPIVYLSRALQLPEVQQREKDDGSVHIVVVQADDHQFGVIVDEISDTQEIVVKPLGKQLHGVSVFAGATILGDGKVALILDMVGLAQRTNVLSQIRDHATKEEGEKVADASEQRQALLLLGSRDGGRMAVPLSAVARLEEFPRTQVERSGGQSVVQYRGEIMPLIDVDGVLPDSRREARGGAAQAASDSIHVVVQSVSGRSVGLVVHCILDVVDEVVSVQRKTPRPGVLGSVVVQNRVTELLDVPNLVRMADAALA